MFRRQVKRLCSAASSNQAINFVNPGGNLTLSHRKRAIPCPIEFYHNRGVFLETGKVDNGDMFIWHKITFAAISLNVKTLNCLRTFSPIIRFANNIAFKAFSLFTSFLRKKDFVVLAKWKYIAFLMITAAYKIHKTSKSDLKCANHAFQILDLRRKKATKKIKAFWPVFYGS